MKLTNQQFDEIVRQRIKALPPAELPPTGWDQLSADLAIAPAERFDDTLRDALTASPLAVASDWEALARRMDPDMAEDIQIASALSSLTPAMVPGSWDKLQERMTAEAAVAMDKTVVEHLSRDLSHQVSGWAALAARLELIGHRRGLVAAWKITEFSLLLSALLLFTRFVSIPSASPQINTFPFPAEGAPTAAVLWPSAPVATADKTPTDELVGQVPVATPAPNRPGTSVNRLPQLPEQTLARNTVVPFPQSTPDNAERPASSDLLKVETTMLDNPTALPSPALHLKPMDNAAPVRYALNAFISPFDFNQVITPAAAIRDFDISADNRLTTGYSAGVLVDIYQGKNGLQTGLIYSRRSYIPTALKWYLEEDYPVIEPIRGYSRFVFDAITIPLSYRRTLTENDRWRFSGRFGMSMSIIASSSFNHPEGQERFVESFNSFAEQDLPQGSGRGLFKAGGLSSRRLTNPEPGWLEGGSILTNSSFYLNGGVTIERLVNERFSLYVSPSFGRVVYLRDSDGIGPYQDRIHTGSIRLGSRFLLSKK